MGQTNENYINLKFDTIESINWKAFDYYQMKPFESILKNHDLLILSEGNHGDGASVDAQTMILKGLIDSGRINTIYLESNWLNVEKIMEVLYLYGRDSVKSVIQYMRTTELLYWADNGFWDYLVGKIIEKKVKLFGFDISGPSEKVFNPMLREALQLEVVQKIRISDPVLYDNAVLFLQHIEYYDDQTFFQKNTYGDIKPFFDLIINTYKRTNNSDKARQWEAIDNLFFWMHKRSRVTENNKAVNVIDSKLQFSQFHSSRDSMMAEIFFNYFLNQKDQKAVATMSAYHAMHNSNEIDKIDNCCKSPNICILGEKIEKKLGDRIYNICFVKANGVTSINDYFSHTRPLKVQEPPKGSLEFWLSKRKIPFAFIDLQDSSLKNKIFYMNAVFNKYLSSNWSRNFSGVFFIQSMYPLIFRNPSTINQINN